MLLAEQGLEATLDSIPFASIPVVLGTEIWNMRKDGKSFREALRLSKRRLRRAGAYSTIEAAMNTTPAAPVSIPVTLALRLAQTRIGQRVAQDTHMEEKTKEILREIDASQLSILTA